MVFLKKKIGFRDFLHYSLYQVTRSHKLTCGFGGLTRVSSSVTSSIFYILFRDTLKILSVIFLYTFHLNLYQNFSGVSLIPVGSKLSKKSYYTSNFISQLYPIILDFNPTHHHQHNTSYSITSYNSSS